MSLPAPKRDARPEEVERVWALHQQVVQLITLANKAFIQLGRLLTIIEEERLYEFLGYRTFNEYLASPEVCLHRTTVFRLTRIAKLVDRGVVSEHDAIQIGATRLNIAARALEEAPPEQREEIIHEAKTLTVGDLRQRIRERIEPEEDELKALKRDITHLLIHAAKVVWETTDLAQYLRTVGEELLRFADRVEWVAQTRGLWPSQNRQLDDAKITRDTQN